MRCSSPTSDTRNSNDSSTGIVMTSADWSSSVRHTRTGYRACMARWDLIGRCGEHLWYLSMLRPHGHGRIRRSAAGSNSTFKRRQTLHHSWSRATLLPTVAVDGAHRWGNAPAVNHVARQRKSTGARLPAFYRRRAVHRIAYFSRSSGAPLPGARFD